MTANEIKKFITHGHTLLGFEYKSKDGHIDPYGDSYLLYFDGNEQTVYSVEEVMTTPFINGKCLNDVAKELVITDM
ncbi:MAG: hypothetical protein E7391_03865 [Ruminococcaceae bacterium]|nr:hypothetical protein [Oscillospiraceae bacterium]